MVSLGHQYWGKCQRKHKDLYCLDVRGLDLLSNERDVDMSSEIWVLF